MAHSKYDLSLYLHVPFCRGKCLYCDFYSVPCRKTPDDLRRLVIEQTLEQVSLFLDGSERLETIYVGGGTPSVLPSDELRMILRAIEGRDAAEWTVEANPESIDESFLSLCADAGVTRISMGIQSMDEASLGMLGRMGSVLDNRRALELIGKIWHGDVNIDFIAGIPGQTPAQMRSELALLDTMHVSHVSLYSLTVEPGTGLAQCVERGVMRLNAQDLDEDIWFAGKEELERRGFQHYEISNFCLPGRQSLHNLRYWNMQPYIGVGPSSVSTLPPEIVARVLDRPELPGSGPVRLTNPRDLASFIRGKKDGWGMEIEVIQPYEFLIENLMMGLRIDEGIPTGRIEKRFGRSFEQLFPGLWRSWVDKGFAQETVGRLRLTEKGRLMLDPLMREIAGLSRKVDLPSGAPHWPEENAEAF